MNGICFDFPEPRLINGVTIIGPDLFATDEQGKPLSPIASAFPEDGVIVTGRGIHAMQAQTMLDFLRARTYREDRRELTKEEEEEVYQNSVALLIRHPVILIRSDPFAMEKVFTADELLQRLISKDCIQFTGIQQAAVRRRLRRRGESWRISPPPHSMPDIQRFIESSRVQVNTGATYYYNVSTGGRFITHQEFMKIRPLLHADRHEALARLEEISSLIRLTNNLGVHELSFFLPCEEALETDDLENLIEVLAAATSDMDLDEAEYLFARFSMKFAAAAGLELSVDSTNEAAWATTMFCRLYDINEKEVEEWALGLSPEFRLNVRWLPGARISGELLFESNTEDRIRKLMRHYWQMRPGIVSINVGRVESSQTIRDRTGEQRDVYLVVLGLADGTEDIRIVRMIKWDVMHRVKRGTPLHQAIAETIQYRDYIFDRLRAAAELGIPKLCYTEIRLEEEIAQLGRIPVFFFDRQYVVGIVTDKIPLGSYARPGFVVELAGLLGIAAAISLILGRACPRSGHVFFDDGDEVIQLGTDDLPERLTIADTTGSFTDWCTPVKDSLPHCLWHLALHLERAGQHGIEQAELNAAVAAFATSFTSEIQRMQRLLDSPEKNLRSLFADRTNEPGGIRHRWEAILRRLQTTEIQQVLQVILDSPHLASLRKSQQVILPG
jgi:hypothetical protein